MNRGGGKFFRPGKAAPVFDDDSSGSEDDSDDDSVVDEPAPQNNNDNSSTAMAMAPPPPPTKQRPNANLSSSEDSDDEEEEPEEPDPEPSNKRKSASAAPPKKKSRTNQFFDEYAADDDDDANSDLEYGTHVDPNDRVKKHYTEDDIRRENMDAEALEIINRQNRRRMHTTKFSAEDDVADITRQIEMRHRLESSRVERSVLDIDSGGKGDSAVVTQQSLLPSVSDPTLWMFNCPTGKEASLVIQIMNKCVSFARQGKPLGITSAVAAQSKGRVYVESFSEPAVREAITGIRGLMAYSMRLVPIRDMTTVMTVKTKKKPVKTNEWVRMSRGQFKGDLALVKMVRESGTKCVIQCVPRIDLTLSELTPEEARIRRRTVKPPQKFFNAQEIAALGKLSVTRQRFPGLDIYCDVFEGCYYHDGYMLKEVTVGTMVKPCGEDEPPTLDELQRFRNRSANKESEYEEDENEGSKIAKSLLDELSELQGKTSLGMEGSNSAGLVIGDTVEIVEGDLVGMRGKLLSMDGSTVKVKPIADDGSEDLSEMAMNEVEFLVSQVRKHIAVGAHVKVISGRYANETGTVVAVEKLEGESDFTAAILTDMTHKEVLVRISQLQESAEVASGQDKLAGYELHDLVVLSGGGSTNEVGCIVRVGREEFTVINNHGIVREVRPEELRGKRNSSSGRAVALDVQGNQIRVGDTVKVAEGPHKGKSATIKRMSRAQLFLYSQTLTKNAGVFVVRSRSCVLSGNRVQNLEAAGGASPFSTPRSNGSQQGGPRGGRKDDGLIGKTIRIQAGNWKGYLGTVSDATPTHVQVELHSRLKKIMVLRERVAVVGDKFGATEDPTRSMGGGGSMMAPTTPFIGGATPMHGGATPMHGGATPMHGESMGGGFTPSHGSSGTDDIWRPGASIDRQVDDMGLDNGMGMGGDDTSTWTPGGAMGGGDNASDVPKTEEYGGSSVNDNDGGGWGSSNGNDNAGSSTNNNSNNAASTTTESNSNSNSNAPAIPKEEPDYGRQMDASSSTHMKMGGHTHDHDGEQAPVWFMERVCITLRKNDQPAVIKDVSNNTATIEMEGDKSSHKVSSGECAMVSPKEGDTVLVTGGADVGVEGELVCIDGSDAILKDSNEDFKIVDLVHLAKIMQEV